MIANCPRPYINVFSGSCLCNKKLLVAQCVAFSWTMHLSPFILIFLMVSFAVGSVRAGPVQWETQRLNIKELQNAFVCFSLYLWSLTLRFICTQQSCHITWSCLENWASNGGPGCVHSQWNHRMQFFFRRPLLCLLGGRLIHSSQRKLLEPIGKHSCFPWFYHSIPYASRAFICCSADLTVTTDVHSSRSSWLVAVICLHVACLALFCLAVLTPWVVSFLLIMPPFLPDAF